MSAQRVLNVDSVEGLARKYKESALKNCPDDKSEIFCAMVIDLIFSKELADAALAFRLLKEEYVMESDNKLIGVLDAYIYYAACGNSLHKGIYDRAYEYLYDILVGDKDWTQGRIAEKILELLARSDYVSHIDSLTRLCCEIEPDCPYIDAVLYGFHSLVQKNNNIMNRAMITSSLRSLSICGNVLRWSNEAKECLSNIGNSFTMDQPSTLTEDPKRIRVAIALSGGGLRAALFHSGVLSGLIEQIKNAGAPIDIARVYGVSGGAIIGSFFCLGNDPVEFWQRLHNLANSKLKKAKFARLLIPFTSPKKLAQLIEQEIFLKSYSFDELQREPSLAIQTFDRITAEKLVFSRYSLSEHKDYKVADAVAASCAIPPFIRPMKIEKMVIGNYLGEFDLKKAENSPIIVQGEQRILHDGGLVENSGLETALSEMDNFDLLVICDCGALLFRENSFSLFKIVSYFKRFVDASLSRREKDLKDRCRQIFNNRFVEIGADASIRNIPTFSIPDVKEVDKLFEHGKEKSRAAWHALTEVIKLK